MNDVLTLPQQRAADRVLDEESARREHLVIYLSGAHAYGFPSPDSDLDLKAIHVAPTRDLLGLSPSFGGGERLEVIDGVEVDYSSNEVGTALAGMLGGNGNYLERVLGALVVRASPALASLIPLARAALSRRVYRHYRGFATGVLREADATPAPAAKKLLYVLRTALTGTHLLTTGEMVTDLRTLAPLHNFDVTDLITRKLAGERTVLSADEAAHWRREAVRAFAALDAARASSPLPEEPTNTADLDAWLISLRLGALG